MSGPFNLRQLGIWLVAASALFIAGIIMMAGTLPIGWEIAFIAPIGVMFVGVIAPRIWSYIPSSVFLDVLTIDISRPNSVSYKLSLFSEFRWELNPGYATLCLRRKDDGPDVTTGVPLEMSREQISQFLRKLGISQAE